MHRPFLPLAVLVLGTSAIAQTVVSPSVFTNGPGNSSNAFPWGSSFASQRYQSVHDDMAGKIGVIKGIAGRMNEGATFPGATCNLEVRISTAATTAFAATSTFDTNHGADKVTAVGPATPFNFAALPATLPVSPFAFVVPFTTTFTFVGTGGICWETLMDTRVTSAQVAVDCGTGNAAFNFYGVSYGAGCLASGKTTAASCSSTYAAATGVTFSAANLANSAPGSIVLGLSRTSWLSLPLPFDIPGTTGYASGTCRVYSDWVVELPMTTSATGTLSLAVPITLGPSTKNVILYNYSYCLDVAANAIGLVTTHGRLNELGDGTVIGGCRIYVNTNNASATGTKDNSTSAVTQFQY